eukprot:3843877-Prymnesium_polylepis.1
MSHTKQHTITCRGCHTTHTQHASPWPPASTVIARREPWSSGGWPPSGTEHTLADSHDRDRLERVERGHKLAAARREGGGRAVGDDRAALRVGAARCERAAVRDRAARRRDRRAAR